MKKKLHGKTCKKGYEWDENKRKCVLTVDLRLKLIKTLFVIISGVLSVFLGLSTYVFNFFPEHRSGFMIAFWVCVPLCCIGFVSIFHKMWSYHP